MFTDMLHLIFYFLKWTVIDNLIPFETKERQNILNWDWLKKISIAFYVSINYISLILPKI